MKLLVFSVVDGPAGAFMQPFFAPTVGVARRMFKDAVNAEGHEFHKHASDYALYQVGEFNQESGALVPLSPIEHLGGAVSYLEERE